MPWSTNTFSTLVRFGGLTPAHCRCITDSRLESAPLFSWAPCAICYSSLVSFSPLSPLSIVRSHLTFCLLQSIHRPFFFNHLLFVVIVPLTRVSCCLALQCPVTALSPYFDFDVLRDFSVRRTNSKLTPPSFF